MGTPKLDQTYIQLTTLQMCLISPAFFLYTSLYSGTVTYKGRKKRQNKNKDTHTRPSHLLIRMRG